MALGVMILVTDGVDSAVVDQVDHENITKQNILLVPGAMLAQASISGQVQWDRSDMVGSSESVQHSAGVKSTRPNHFCRMQQTNHHLLKLLKVCFRLEKPLIHQSKGLVNLVRG